MYYLYFKKSLLTKEIWDKFRNSDFINTFDCPFEELELEFNHWLPSHVELDIDPNYYLFFIRYYPSSQLQESITEYDLFRYNTSVSSLEEEEIFSKITHYYNGIYK